jgi:general secretion pathway protein D
VPIIGNLFKSADREKRRTELLILLTPHIVRNTKETDQATQDLKKRMKLIESLKKKVKS